MRVAVIATQMFAERQMRDIAMSVTDRLDERFENDNSESWAVFDRTQEPISRQIGQFQGVLMGGIDDVARFPHTF